ncbi:MAG: serine/threonine protein kinase [Leptolyngbyaceae cyanobacterium]
MISSSVLQTTPRLLNRYSIQQILGARLGRRTYLGFDHQCNSWVVIKYLCFDDPLQPADIKRFQVETATLKSLNHPAIPSYCDSFDINDHGYHGLMVVQEYIEGQSLYALVKSKQLFTEQDVCDVARQILEILTHLHRQQPMIIHRDIKPSSFVLSPLPSSKLGKIYLVDFGLVERSNQTHESADTPILISGTPGYRPPEQLGDKASPATDLYSLGATLVHLATGKHPNTLPQRGLRILFSQELGHISRPIKSWLCWLTQPKQHKRPISAQAALKGLEQADQIFAPSSLLSVSNLGQRFHRALLQTMAPADTQLKLFEYSQTLEVLLPPLGWKSGQFCLAMVKLAICTAGLWLMFNGFPDGWSQLSAPWQKFLYLGLGLGWTHLNLRIACQGLKSMVTSLFRQVSIQLLPDIILLGYRFPCRPVDYHINTYKHDIEDIDLQPSSSVIKFHLRNNRTVVGNLKYDFSAKALGLNQAEIKWINNILQLWLKHQASRGAV